MKPQIRFLAIAVLCLMISAQSRSYGQVSTSKSPQLLGTIVDFSKLEIAPTIEFRSRIDGPGSGGGGGNSCALMLQQNTAVLLERLDNYKDLKDRTEDYHKLITKIKTAKFVLGQNLYLDGEKKDAINDPTAGTIVLEKSFCERMDTVSDATVGTLLHEFLGLARIDDKQFQISGNFVRFFNASMNRTERFENFYFSKGMAGHGCPTFGGEYLIVGLTQKAEYKREKHVKISPGYNPVFYPKVSFQDRLSEAFGNQFAVVHALFSGPTATLQRSKLISFYDHGKFVQKDADDSLIIDGQEHSRSDPDSADYYEKYRAGCAEGKLFLEYGSAHNTSPYVSGKIERVSTYVLRIIVQPTSPKELTVTTQSEHFNNDGRLIFKSYEKAELEKD